MRAPFDASSRVPWPPILFAANGAAAGILTWRVPLPVLPQAAIWPAWVLGIVAVLAGVACAAAAVAAFLRARTAIPPNRPTTAIVSGGIYGRTRNPMYLGMTTVLAGSGLAIDSPWFLLAAAADMLAVTKLAIEPEERYLAQKFGEAYLAYKARVRRWL